jgi:hypothetical protein
MAASQGVSRGFHRLGLFLAAIIVLVGGYYWVVSASEVANQDWRHHKALVCAHHFRHRDEKRFWELSLTELDDNGANSLTLDEARRIASNIAKLPTLLGKGD